MNKEFLVKFNVFKSVFLIFFLILPKATATEPTVNTKVIMAQFLEHLTALRKYMGSEKKFTDPKNAVVISEHLKQFSQIAKATKHDPQLHLENYEMSRAVLVNHISETEQVFKGGNKAYARWMLNSTIYVCMSCHTQMPAQDRKSFNFDDNKSYFSDFEQAEFLFAARNFEEASKMYDAIIKKMQQFENFEVERSLERQVAYYARIKRDPVAAQKKLKEYLGLRKVPDYIKKDLASWIAQFEKWQEQKALDPKTATETDILDFAQNQLESVSVKQSSANYPNLVNYLRVSGILYEYLQTHPNSKATPQLLYWLSFADRYTNNNFFFSLADLYLRECIIKFPSSSIAKKCYKEYENETILSYSGSGGVFMPEAVKNDLKALKKLVDSGGKVKLNYGF